VDLLFQKDKDVKDGCKMGRKSRNVPRGGKDLRHETDFESLPRLNMDH
jgi:hypothetical protein